MRIRRHPLLSVGFGIALSVKEGKKGATGSMGKEKMGCLLISAVQSESHCSSFPFPLFLFPFFYTFCNSAKRYEKCVTRRRGAAEKRSEALNSSASPRLRVSPLLSVGFGIAPNVRGGKEGNGANGKRRNRVSVDIRGSQ
jgi:hypothetical protein